MNTAQPITFDNEPARIQALRIGRTAFNEARATYIMALQGRRDTRYFAAAWEALVQAHKAMQYAYEAQMESDQWRLEITCDLAHLCLYETRRQINKFYAGSGIQ